MILSMYVCMYVCMYIYMHIYALNYSAICTAYRQKLAGSIPCFYGYFRKLGQGALQ